MRSRMVLFFKWFYHIQETQKRIKAVKAHKAINTQFRPIQRAGKLRRTSNYDITKTGRLEGADRFWPHFMSFGYYHVDEFTGDEDGESWG